MKENINYSYFIQNLGVFFIVFSYFDVISNMFGIGLALALLAIGYRKLKYNYPILNVSLQDIPKVMVSCMLFFIIMLGISSLGFEWSLESLRKAEIFFKYMRPFLVLFLLFNETKGFFMAFSCAILVGSLALCFGGDNALYQFFVLGQRRPTGLIGNPNSLAAHLLLVIPFILGIIFKYRKNLILRNISIIVLFISLVTLFVTESRGAILAFLIISFLAICYYAKNYKKAITFILIGTIMISSISLVVGDNSKSRILKLSKYLSISDYEINRNDDDYIRIKIWKAASNMFLENPVHGIGLGNFDKVYSEQYNNKKPTNLYHAHNMFLFIFSETGIIGGIGFLVLLGYQVYYLCINRYKKTGNICVDIMLFSMLLMIIHGLVDSVFQYATFARIYWMLWGCTCLSIIYYKKYSKITRMLRCF